MLISVGMLIDQAFAGSRRLHYSSLGRGVSVCPSHDLSYALVFGLMKEIDQHMGWNDAGECTKLHLHCLPPCPPCCLADWCTSTHSSYCSLASRLREAIHPEWSMLFGSWRWCLVRTHCHSICPFAQHNGEQSREWSIRCRWKSNQQWRRVRHNGGKQSCCLRNSKRVQFVGRRPRGICLPLYSRKLHMRVLRARTNWVTSLIIFAFSFGESVVNHLASLYN